MVALIVAGTSFALVFIAEILHARRVRRAKFLAFGPTGRPRAWTRLAPAVRVTAMMVAAWGLTTLFLLPPRAYDRAGIQSLHQKEDTRDLILVLDVSPSMRLQDSGTEGSISRGTRAAELLRSFYSRIPMNRFRTSVIACYTGAKPVVERTTDPEIIRNILTDLPMHFAFRAGPTDLFSGIAEAARMARGWRADSATLIVVSDGDTVPPAGMPGIPPSISHVLVVGVGDTTTGKFIDGHQSRQDATSLRQLAIRLNGDYHDGNVNHISTALIEEAIRSESPPSSREAFPLRAYALIAVVAGTVLLAILPVLLHVAGSQWQPGVPARKRTLLAGTVIGLRRMPSQTPRE